MDNGGHFVHFQFYIDNFIAGLYQKGIPDIGFYMSEKETSFLYKKVDKFFSLDVPLRAPVIAEATLYCRDSIFQ